MTAGSITVPTIIPLRAPINGKLKNLIDTSVPIELKTETPNAEIYFTVDGSKPDPYAPLGSDTNTIKYTRPFKLREGKRTVKALAVSRDGTRESNVVTKAFDVEKDSNTENHEKIKDDSYAFIDELQRERKQALAQKRGILKNIHDNSRTFNDTFRSTGSLSDHENSGRRDTRFLGQRFTNRTFSATVNNHPQHHHSHHNQSFNDSRLNAFNRSHDDLSTSVVSQKYVLPDSSTQALRLQRETDFLRCIYCFAARPSDPFAKYCNDCGKALPQIPQNKLPPPELGQLGKCFYCKSNVPFNTTICVICEKPIMPQLQPQASIKLQGKIICPVCTTGNPSNYTTCVTCENKLPPDAKIYPVDFNAPLLPVATVHQATPGKTVTCSQCYRLNNSDARFCDWCGSKPQKTVKPINCGKCGANNHAHSKFCTSCGVIVQAPVNTLNTQALSQALNSATWLNPSDFHQNGKHYHSASTQTFGIFYTSSKALENKTEKEEKQVETEKKLHDKKPLLTAVSAGKGYWRQQMDHICAHLKAYAQNNAEFRSLVSEPRLGKINSAKVDVDSNWCTITATFPIRNNKNKDIFNSSAMIDHRLGGANTRFNDNDYEMMAITGVKSTSESEDSASGSDDSDVRLRKEMKQAKLKKHKKKKFEKLQANEDRLNPEDRQLFKELSKEGKGRLREVKQFLNDGANVNAINKDGLNALHLAIRNRHLECISCLLDANADIAVKVPPHGNTVLHEAVLLGGKDSESVINLLLEYRANPNWKNSKNETPYDLAVKKSNANAIHCFNSHTSDAMLKDYTRAKGASIKP